MAKRKRLSPVPAFVASGEEGAPPAPSDPRARPPIAEISGGAAAQAAFEEVAEELRQARDTGRMVITLPLEAVKAGHLVRDRVALDPDEMEDLKDSLRTRGQQTPIEVVDLGAGRYGLISGWRRLAALRALSEEGQAASIQALVRAPIDAGDAYRAMVEENEIRADLSFFERARIAVKAAEQNVFLDTKKAVQTLFSSVRAPKRSKIISFTVLVQALEDELKFPTAIPEKLGLALVKALQEDPAFQQVLTARLRAGEPVDAAAERAILEEALRGERSPRTPAAGAEVTPGVTLRGRKGHVTLSGVGVDASLLADLQAWLKQRGA